MKNKFVILIVLFLVSTCFATLTCGKPKPAAKALRIILIRHAEKADDGNNLSCSGLNRSLKLPAVIKSKYGIPDYIYVPTVSPDKKTKDLRMLQTVTPLAVKYNLDINSSFDVDDVKQLAKDIKDETGTILVVWEHKRLVDIARALAPKAGYLNWDGDEFDKIWIITITNGKAVLTVDKENIHPDSNCSF